MGRQWGEAAAVCVYQGPDRRGWEIATSPACVCVCVRECVCVFLRHHAILHVSVRVDVVL